MYYLYCPLSYFSRWQRRYAFIDTPGQIEAFTWSASGDIMTKMCVHIYTSALVTGGDMHGVGDWHAPVLVTGGDVYASVLVNEGDI